MSLTTCLIACDPRGGHRPTMPSARANSTATKLDIPTQGRRIVMVPSPAAASGVLMPPSPTAAEAGSVVRYSGGRYGSPPTPPLGFLYLPKRAGPSSTSTIIRACPRHTYVRECKAQVGIRGIVLPPPQGKRTKGSHR